MQQTEAEQRAMRTIQCSVRCGIAKRELWQLREWWQEDQKWRNALKRRRYIHIYICIFICIRTHSHTHTSTHTHTHTCTQHAHTHTHIHKRTHIHTNTYTYTHSPIHACTHIHKSPPSLANTQAADRAAGARVAPRRKSAGARGRPLRRDRALWHAWRGGGCADHPGRVACGGASAPAPHPALRA